MLILEFAPLAFLEFHFSWNPRMALLEETLEKDQAKKMVPDWAKNRNPLRCAEELHDNKLLFYLSWCNDLFRSVLPLVNTVINPDRRLGKLRFNEAVAALMKRLLHLGGSPGFVLETLRHPLLFDQYQLHWTQNSLLTLHAFGRWETVEVLVNGYPVRSKREKTLLNLTGLFVWSLLLSDPKGFSPDFVCVNTKGPACCFWTSINWKSSTALMPQHAGQTWLESESTAFRDCCNISSICIEANDKLLASDKASLCW